MKTEMKVAHTLQVAGIILLLLCFKLKLPIFWPVFGFFMLVVGSVNVLIELVSNWPKKSEGEK